MNIRQAYADAVGRDGLTSDPEQQRIVDSLGNLQEKLEQPPAGSLLEKIGLSKRRHTPPGLYLWGGVGRGKTFLMDLFFSNLAIDDKRRIHFHRMMREIHARLREHDAIEDPLDAVASDICRETRVLCFDEFFVSDIGDAMVLGRLMSRLFEHGLTLVATSNSPPSGLYSNGLQRERFLPAIESLETHTRVEQLRGGDDYRLRVLQKAATYLTPTGQAADTQLAEFFESICPGESTEGQLLDVLGRQIPTKRCAKGIAWFDFHDLCDGPRGQNDYIEIARWYQTVIVSDIPVLDETRENQARRFISLVDEFYDRRVKLLLSADAAANDIYQGDKLAFEFERTTSRLIEMQSAEYLHEAHLA